MFNVCSDVQLRCLKITGIIQFGKDVKKFAGINTVEIPIQLPKPGEQVAFAIDFNQINDKILDMLKIGRVLITCPSGHIANAQAVAFLIRERKLRLDFAICAVMKIRMEAMSMPSLLFSQLNSYIEELKQKEVKIKS